MDISVYRYVDAGFNHSHEYLVPSLVKVLRKFFPSGQTILFELGFGNGATANYLNHLGYEIVGVDPSEEGVRQANTNYPNLRLHYGHSGENLYERFGSFEFLYSLEVVEHVFDPFEYAQKIHSLLTTGGICVISTPYHGYLKNLVISLAGKWDHHFTALWQGGHIKFWSPATLTRLLETEGLEILAIKRIGRVPILAKSMMIVARKL
jgi:2-polyprenyl-6-hydroxyphenyl methylase/3-demethylubiquinone-9 3-methyltransferase